MRLPQKAPSLIELFSDREFATSLISKILEMPLETQNYLHWDEIRFRPKPEGLSSEQWWAMIKMGRVAARKTIPLVGIDGVPVSFVMTDDVVKALCQIDRKLGSEHEFFSEVPTLSKEHKKSYLIQSLFEESITSSQIEGAVTTRAEAKSMLASGRAPRDKHEQMILNNYQTLTFLKERIRDPLTPELIIEVQRLITDKTPLEVPDAQGRLRLASDPVRLESFDGEVVFTPPPANELPKRIQLLCDFFNNANSSQQFIHPLIRAILVHFWLAYEHPFVDGNGRTARALFYWSTLKQGYPLFEYISISEMILKHSGKYYKSFLYTESDENDATYFIINQLEMIEFAITGLYAHVREKQEAFSEISDQLHRLNWINNRQEQVLLHALKHPGSVYTFETHQGFYKISASLARKDLMQLTDAGLLLLQKRRPFRFISPGDLADRLSRASSI